MFDDKERIIIRGFMTGDQQNDMSICEHTGIKPEHIVSVTIMLFLLNNIVILIITCNRLQRNGLVLISIQHIMLL